MIQKDFAGAVDLLLSFTSKYDNIDCSSDMDYQFYATNGGYVEITNDEDCAAVDDFFGLTAWTIPPGTYFNLVCFAHIPMDVSKGFCWQGSTSISRD